MKKGEPKNNRFLVFLLCLLTFVLLTVFLAPSYFCLIPQSPYVAIRHLDPKFDTAKLTHGKLEKLSDFHMLTSYGEAKDLGEVHGKLLKHQIENMLGDYMDRFYGSKKKLNQALENAKEFEEHLEDYELAEMKELAKAAGVSYEKVLLANAFLDMDLPFACSTFVTSETKSKDGILRFGRNLDFPAFGVAEAYDLLFHVRKKGRLAFVAIGWPGMIGVLSGVNEDGLAVTLNLSFSGQKTKSGYSSLLLVRRILELSSSVDSAKQFITQLKIAGTVNLTIVDKKGQATVAEVEPDKVIFRNFENGYLYATNSFVSPDFDNAYKDERFVTLEKVAKNTHTGLNLDELKETLDSVNQSHLTIQSMIYEPQNKSLFLSIDKIPSTDGEYIKIDLEKIFDQYK